MKCLKLISAVLTEREQQGPKENLRLVMKIGVKEKDAWVFWETKEKEGLCSIDNCHKTLVKYISKKFNLIIDYSHER